MSIKSPQGRRTTYDTWIKLVVNLQKRSLKPMLESWCSSNAGRETVPRCTTDDTECTIAEAKSSTRDDGLLNSRNRCPNVLTSKQQCQSTGGNNWSSIWRAFVDKCILLQSTPYRSRESHGTGNPAAICQWTVFFVTSVHQVILILYCINVSTWKLINSLWNHSRHQTSLYRTR